MNEPTLEMQIDAANDYETIMVPALFAEWAPVVADAAKVQAGHRVLDVACGTGVFAREAARRVGANGTAAGLDPSPGMLEVARQHAPEVAWRQGVAEELPFPDRSFDVVASQFGLMFFQDREKALREILRVLRPNGRLAVAVWDRLEDSEAYPIEVELLDRLAGERAVKALHAPFVLGDTRDLVALHEKSGVRSVEVKTHHGTARFPSVRTMVEADLRGWLPVMGVVLEEKKIEEILEAAEKRSSSTSSRTGRWCSTHRDKS